MLPAYANQLGPIPFLISVLFVFFTLGGLVALFERIRASLGFEASTPAPIRWVEAVLFMPWLLYPFQLMGSIYGGYLVVLSVIQVVLVSLGVYRFAVARRLHSKQWKQSFAAALRDEPLFAVALAAVGLFLLWGWMMPFPEAFNGHYHHLLGRLQNMARTGTYSFLPAGHVSYDNDILVWPANLVFFLSLFTLPGAPTIGVHPIWLLPGVMAGLTLVLFREVSRQVTRVHVGALGFLLVAFNYFTAGGFSEISFDLLTPVLLTYFLYSVVSAMRDRKLTAVRFVGILALSFLVRKQVFLLTAFSGALAVGYLFLKERVRMDASRAVATGIAVLVLPALQWSMLTWNHYGSPFFPHDTGFTKKLFVLNEYRPYEPALVDGASTPAQEGASAPSKVREILDAKFGGGESYLLEQFFPLLPRKGLAVLIKNFFCGTSVSILIATLGLAFLLFGVHGRRKDCAVADPRALHRVYLALALGYLGIWYVFFPLYPKFPHYLAYWLALPSAWLIGEWSARGRWMRHAVVALGVMTAFMGGVFWALNTWGHGQKDPSFKNVRFLWPAYGTVVDRIARKSNREPAEVEAEIREYTAAVELLGPGEQILFMEHEPGALIPALLDRQYLGNVLYLENHRSESLFKARSDEEVRRAFDTLKIRYVYRPKRPHGIFDQTYLMRAVRGYRGPAQHLIPVGEMFQEG